MKIITFWQSQKYIVNIYINVNISLNNFFLLDRSNEKNKNKYWPVSTPIGHDDLAEFYEIPYITKKKVI